MSVAIILAAHARAPEPEADESGAGAAAGAMASRTAAANMDRAATLDIAARKAAAHVHGEGCCP